MPTPNEFLCPCPQCGYDFGLKATTHAQTNAGTLETLLHNNSAPKPAEKQAILDYLAEMDGELTRSDDQIAFFKQCITLLEQKQEDILQDIKRCKSTLSPIRRLSKDILAQIFIQCLPQPGSFTRDSTCRLQDTRYREHTPWWSLSLVSSGWRTVSVSLPQLWSQVGLIIDSRTLEGPHRSEKIAFFLGIQLYRSASHPLVVHVDLWGDIPPSHAALQILLPTSPRWQSLKFDVPDQSLHLLSRLRGCLQSLEYLDIGRYDSTPLDLFAYAPKLHTLIGKSNPIPFISHFQLPWSQIQSYTSERPLDSESYQNLPNYKAQVDMLRLMPHLESFKMNCQYRPHLDKNILGLTHDHLRTLTIIERLVQTEHVLFLSYLTLPALKELDLDARDGYARTKVTRRSVNPKLLYTILPNGVRNRALKGMPALRRLRINGEWELALDIGQHLASDVTLMPDLEYLSMGRFRDAALAARLVKHRPGLRVL